MISHTGVSPKWVKSKRRRRKKKRREILNDGNNNGQATHGARMAHASRLAKILGKTNFHTQEFPRSWPWRKSCFEIKSLNPYSPRLGRAPPEVAFAMHSWPLLLPTFFFWPRRLCVRHPRCRLQCVAGHCCYHLSVSLSLFLFRLLLLTHFRETPVCENLFPPIFCHN